MADPYATSTPDLSRRPDGPPPWKGDVERLGGVMIGSDGSVGSRGAAGVAAESGFAFIPCSGVGSLAPLALVEPPMAVLLWLEHIARERHARVANRLLGELADSAVPILAVKHGSVGGPAERPGCAEVRPETVVGLLERRDEIVWEPDPDFAYSVPSLAPGIADPEARMLMPRLLYADNDRVYEHADLVADKKRERYGVAERIPGLDPTILAVAGWPPEASSDDWRD